MQEGFTPEFIKWMITYANTSHWCISLEQYICYWFNYILICNITKFWLLILLMFIWWFFDKFYIYHSSYRKHRNLWHRSRQYKQYIMYMTPENIYITTNNIRWVQWSHFEYIHLWRENTHCLNASRNVFYTHTPCIISNTYYMTVSSNVSWYYTYNPESEWSGLGNFFFAFETPFTSFTHLD